MAEEEKVVFMPSRRVRFLFTVTSLAPIFITLAAVLVFDRGQILAWNSYKAWAVLCVVFVVGTIVVCERLLKLWAKEVDYGPLKIESLRVADRSAITFVVAYALPLASAPIQGINIFTLAVVLALLAILVYQSEAYLVNPLLALPPFNYHFYEVSSDDQVTYILVSKREILDTREPVIVRQVSRFMFFEAER